MAKDYEPQIPGLDVFEDVTALEAHVTGDGSDHEDVADNTAASHTQGTDQGLDSGGANAVTAAQAKAGYTHVSNDGSDHSKVGANETAIGLNTTHRGLTNNPHNTTVSTLEATLTNKAGANTIVGYVYRLDPDNDASFDYAAEDGDYQVVVAQTADIADASSATDMVMAGQCEVYLDGVTDADISANIKYLYFGATSGQAKVERYRQDGCFGEAIEDSSGAGLSTCIVYPRERIKQWDWHQRDAWNNCISVPICSEQTNVITPVLVPGAGGEHDDTALTTPCLYWNRNKNVFEVFYTAQKDNAGTNEFTIAVATGDPLDPTGTHTKYGSNPIMSPLGTASWEDSGNGIATPVIIYDKYEKTASKRTKMFYGGSKASASSAIGLAYIEDDYTITRYASNPVIVHAFGDTLANSCTFGVISAGANIYLYYRNSANSLSACYSKDGGKTFTNIGVVYTPPGGYAVLTVSVFFNNGWYFLCTGITHGVDLTNSYLINVINGSNLDVAADYTVASQKLIIATNNNTWDDQYLTSGTMRAINGDFYLWYYALDNATSNGSIGVIKMGETS